MCHTFLCIQVSRIQLLNINTVLKKVLLIISNAQKENIFNLNKIQTLRTRLRKPNNTVCSRVFLIQVKQVVSMVHQTIYVLVVCISHSILPDSLQTQGLQPTRLLVHEIFQARILECVAMSFFMGSSQPRDPTRVSCTAGRFFTN